MVNWLAKASGVLSRETVDVQQPFQLTCECGESHLGQRKSRPQRIICQTCGTALFVLPRNVYPQLKPLKPKRKRRGKNRSGTGRPAPGGQRARRAKVGVQDAVMAVGSAVKRAIGFVINSVIAAVMNVLGWARRQITPFRTVVASVVVMLIATGVWTIRSRGLDQAREILRLEFAAGEEALNTDDLVLANQHFEQAATAADRLQSFDVRGELARQMFRETTAITRLTPSSLIEMLEEADTFIADKSPEAWADQFRAKYKGTWIVLQAPLHAVIESEQTASLVVELPLLVGESGRSVSLTAVEVAADDLGVSGEPRVTWFAAMLDDCVFDQRQQSWSVTLSGESCFLWANIDNLRRLGFFETDWIPEEETVQLLDEQSELLGLK